METHPVELMLKGYGLTTAEMIYRMPDHIHVLNTFVWQDYDLAPDYPRLFEFIEFWQDSIEGPLHSVRFTHRKQLNAGEWRHVVGEFEVGKFNIRDMRVH
ncbi:usg protein [Roseinatronobacter monicus]|uniref:usg protein n=1 Tax=Roseinatronobacter monicus TaxID=393481 RepID=UPI003F35F11A